MFKWSPCSCFTIYSKLASLRLVLRSWPVPQWDDVGTGTGTSSALTNGRQELPKRAFHFSHRCRCRCRSPMRNGPKLRRRQKRCRRNCSTTKSRSQSNSPSQSWRTKAGNLPIRRSTDLLHKWGSQRHAVWQCETVARQSLGPIRMLILEPSGGPEKSRPSLGSSGIQGVEGVALSCLCHY